MNRLINWFRVKWEDFKHWLLGPRYNPVRWSWRGTSVTFSDDEAFIQLYNIIVYQGAKGGCKDFFEITYYNEENGDSWSELVFKNKVVLGNSKMIIENI